MNLWREPIVFRKVWMAFSFYPIKYHLWAECCFVYSRYRGNRYISDIPKAPPTENESAFSIIQSVIQSVFVQTNVKNQFSSIVRLIIFYLFCYYFCTSISTINQLIFRGLQHEIIKVSAKWINVNKIYNVSLVLYHPLLLIGLSMNCLSCQFLSQNCLLQPLSMHLVMNSLSAWR